MQKVILKKGKMFRNIEKKPIIMVREQIIKGIKLIDVLNFRFRKKIYPMIDEMVSNKGKSFMSTLQIIDIGYQIHNG